MHPNAILETVLYASDLAAAEAFYTRLLGLTPYAKVDGRHVFYQLESQMLLIFNPEASRKSASPPFSIPPHGAEGEGHVCFAADAGPLARWRIRLGELGIAIEKYHEWPGGGQSIYFRDPACNSIEFAEPRIWGFDK